MPARNSRFFGFTLVIGDFLTLMLAFAAAYTVRVLYDTRPLLDQVFARDYFLSFLTITPLWIIIFACLGLYSQSVYNRRLASWARIFLGCFIGILLVIAWEYVGNEPIVPARLVMVYAFIAAFLLIVIEREVFRFVRHILFKKGRGIARVLLIGNSTVVADVARQLSNSKNSGYKVIAILSPKKYVPKELNLKHYSNLDEAIKGIKRHRISALIQTSFFEDDSKNKKILSASQSNHIDYSFIPGEAGFYSGKNTVDVFLGYPMITVSQTPLTGWSVIFKRFFDLLVVFIATPIWGLAFLTIMLCQLLFNPGPIFFKQTRIGRYKKKFAFYKFRSMIPKYCGQDAIQIFENMGRKDLAKEYAKTRKIKNDPRITKFGRILRQTSLDELGQIINVIKGDMSLVGPRPILPDELDFYKSRSPLLLSVKPGITGLASVSGRSDLPFEKRVDLELFYAQNWSFLLDLKILFKTVKVVFTKKGVA